MKVVDFTTPKKTTRKLRRDRPTEPMMYVNLGMPEKLFLMVQEQAKANFRSVVKEINFRITRDLDRGDK